MYQFCFAIGRRRQRPDQDRIGQVGAGRGDTNAPAGEAAKKAAM